MSGNGTSTEPGGRRAPPLWRLLQAAARVVQAVRSGSSATPAVAAIEDGIRPGAQSLAFHALRELGRAEALRARLASRAPPPAADALLCTALALAWDASRAPYDPHTLVNQAVEAAKRDAATARQASFVNACLRRFLREQAELVAATDASPVARWNHPAWWIDRLRRDHPDRWQDILRTDNEPGPMVLRVNVRRWTVPQALRQLADAGIEAWQVGAHALRLAYPRPVHEIPGFAEGALSVQDAGAQLAAPLLLDALPADTRARRILDACAAPGGKTAHLLELADAEVTALDVDPARCARITENLKRLSLSARIVNADGARPQDWWDGLPYDGILLDAPCTASGVVRRHPDVRWLRRDSDVAALAQTQARLLAALWPLLRPGGVLVYCTCSVFRAEGEQQMAAFVAHNTSSTVRAAPGHLLPRSGSKVEGVRDNLPSDHDGFFYALLQKK